MPGYEAYVWMGLLAPKGTPAPIIERLNLLLWVDRCWVASHFAEHLEKLKALRLEWYMLYHNVGTISSRPFYLPYVAFREYGDYCDVLGNLLAVLCGLVQMLDGYDLSAVGLAARAVGLGQLAHAEIDHPQAVMDRARHVAAQHHQLRDFHGVERASVDSSIGAHRTNAGQHL